MGLRSERIKRTRWMPWQLEAMKDVAAHENPGERAARIDPGVSEWGNPAVFTVIAF